MIKRLVLLPGMHGTGELFDEFMRMMPEPKHIEAPYYPADAIPSYDQLQAMVEFIAPASEDFVLLAESFSTPLAIQYAATNPPNLRGLILCAGFATSPLRGCRRSFVSLIAPLAFRLPLPRIAASRFLVGMDAPESLHAAVRSAIHAVRPAVLAARLRQVLATDGRLALGNVSVPILYIQAEQDRWWINGADGQSFDGVACRAGAKPGAAAVGAFEDALAAGRIGAEVHRGRRRGGDVGLNR